MALPAVKYPTFELTVPSTKKVIKYRPFLVKEHKLLLQALELKDTANFINTIYQIIDACTFGKLDVENLAMYDVDYIFLMLRARSIGEMVPVEYKCMNEVRKVSEDGNASFMEPCGTKIRLNLDLNKVKVNIPDGYDEKRVVMIDSDIGIKLRSPTFSKFRELSEIENVDGLFNVTEVLIYSCTECVFEKDKIFVPGKDFTQQDLSEFIEGVPGAAIEQINDFFERLPYVSLDLNIRCPKCGSEDRIELKGLEDFFA